MKAALLIIAVLPFAGCITPAVKLDNAKELMARPDFQTARNAAPEWCRDALKRINALEQQIESK